MIGKASVNSSSSHSPGATTGHLLTLSVPEVGHSQLYCGQGTEHSRNTPTTFLMLELIMANLISIFKVHVWKTIDDNVKLSSPISVFKKRLKDQYFERYLGLFAVLLDFSFFFFIPRSQFHEYLINISYPLYVLCSFVFFYCVCRPKPVANICISWLPIIINFSVILGSQCSPILFVFLIMYLPN